MDLRQRLFEIRSYTPIPFLLIMVFVAKPMLASMLGGLILVILGEMVRLWGVAIAGSETRTTGPVGGSFLITTGPFAYVRNPLYLGNMAIYVGVGIMSASPLLALAAAVYFFVQYSLIVSLEEEYLVKTFGEEFVRYCGEVRRFAPSVRKYRGGTHEQPRLDWKRGLVSERRTLQAIALLTILLAAISLLRSS